MKKFILTFGLLIIAGTGLNLIAQNEQPKIGDGPTLVFKTEMHDYGKIDQHSDGVYEFEFTNTGSAPLVIEFAKGSCGCTVPLWPKEPIAPGASSKLKVEYDTKRIGEFSKTVTINSNATNVKDGISVIRIKGEVLNPAEATPKKDAEGPVNE